MYIGWRSESELPTHISALLKSYGFVSDGAVKLFGMCSIVAALRIAQIRTGDPFVLVAEYTLGSVFGLRIVGGLQERLMIRVFSADDRPANEWRVTADLAFETLIGGAIYLGTVMLAFRVILALAAVAATK